MMPANPEPWRAAPDEFALSTDDVHVWRAGLRPDIGERTATLSSDERARAAAFHFEIDRRRFVASRAILRGLLARYLRVAPGELRFTKGPHGKPRLSHPASALTFNLSHSGEWMLVAVARGREVGVDLEMARENLPVQMLADHHFAPAAAAELRALPEAERARKFYELWTRTEAQLKAGGRGLSRGTTVCDASRWTVQPVFPNPDYTAALAVEGTGFQLKCTAWME